MSRAGSVQATSEAIERVDERLSGAADVARVVAAMHELPDQDQEILVLATWERLPYEEIAEVLAVPVGTVRSRLSRARGRLRELVDLGDQVPRTAMPTCWSDGHMTGRRVQTRLGRSGASSTHGLAAVVFENRL